MGCTVGVLQQNISSYEFTEWLAFWNIDPPADVKRQHEAANMCYTIAQSNSTKSHQYKPKDFLIDYSKGSKKKIAPVDEMVTKLKAWKAGLDGLKIGSK